MKKFIYNIFNKLLLNYPYKIDLILNHLENTSSFNHGYLQNILILKYRELSHNQLFPININEVGFSLYSQHEEDGIILFIFSLIGTTNKKCVEICIGNGKESNTANLINNHSWIGLLYDGDERNINEAINFYQNTKQTSIWPPTIIKKWITAENVNESIEKNEFSGEIDFLSIDIDGIDYWLWKSIDVISPRVVVIEINHLWGPEKSFTVPYNESFKAIFSEHGSDYSGASLSAMIKLGKEKGYYFVGTNKFATNAFFIRNDIKHSWLPERKAINFFQHPRVKYGMEVRFKNIKDLDWIEI